MAATYDNIKLAPVMAGDSRSMALLAGMHAAAFEVLGEQGWSVEAFERLTRDPTIHSYIVQNFQKQDKAAANAVVAKVNHKRSQVSNQGSRVENIYPGNWQMAGFVMLRLVAGEAEIITLGIVPDFQGRRIARRVLIAVFEILASKDIGQVFLEVREDNERAKKLYNSLGFEKTGIRKGYYRKKDGTTKDAYTFNKVVMK